MKLEPELCYRALRSRDARFDGRFFTAVLTTGIYCRPVCSARAPRRENVRFFRCSAAAEEAGYRPCRRCRPESAPGTPAWAGSTAIVSQGLRWIERGALDEGTVEQLATSLGVSSRHLRRLFIDHLGASPLAIAHTRRTHFAKKLIDETDLTMANVAFSSGFSSIRRFNDAVRDRFGKTPTELRGASRNGSSSLAESPLELRLAFRPPFDWESIFEFLGARATPGVEAARDQAYRRTVSTDGGPGIIEVRPVPAKNELALSVSVPASTRLMDIARRVRSIFDLGADPRQIAARLKRHPDMARLVDARPGLRVPGAWDPFELSVRAILGQQVTVKAATTIAGRLAARYGDPVAAPTAHGLSLLFPRAETLAVVRISDLGIPRARARAIRLLAGAVERNEISFDEGDPSQLRGKLTSIPGIGDWTAAYIAMRSLREPDAFPSGDVALRHAASTEARPITPRRLEKIAEVWRPWRAYAAMYLWKSRSIEGFKLNPDPIAMLEMKRECQKCGARLRADGEAYICSFECSFCRECASELEHHCPNCGGELVRRPRRDEEN